MKLPIKICLIIFFLIIDVLAFLGGVLLAIDNIKNKQNLYLFKSALFFCVLFLIFRFQYYFYKNYLK
jgi:hypothetical protein